MDIQLYYDDCRNILPKLESGSIHAIITDLPYGSSICAWDTVIPFDFMWKEVERLLKPKGVFVTTATQPFTSKLVMSNLPWFRYAWVWDKNNSAAFAVVKYRPFLVTEDILVFYKNGCNYHPQMVTKGGNQKRTAYPGKKSDLYHITPDKKRVYAGDYYPKNIIHITKRSGAYHLHPTQKPVLLYEYLIRTYTDEGDTVLDFTMGSGTTGIACIQTNRNFIGVDNDEKYFKIAEERINRMKKSITNEKGQL